MLLLQNHGIPVVHFVGLPPGTADLLVKFMPPETLERFGGAGRYASAIDDFLIHLDVMLQAPASIAELLLGTVPGWAAAVRRAGALSRWQARPGLF
jgi:hypothetical protein